MAFRPNRLMYMTFSRNAINRLKPWQLLVAACHFGPDMGDCRRLDYRYIMKEGMIYYIETGSNEGHILDVDTTDPVSALEGYAGLDWKKWAIGRLKEEWKK